MGSGTRSGGLFLFIGLIAITTSAGAPQAQENCGEFFPLSADGKAEKLEERYAAFVNNRAGEDRRSAFVACVLEATFQKLEGNRGQRAKALENLRFVADRPAWTSEDEGDLSKLISLSAAEKAKSPSDADMIQALDGAILNHKDGISDSLRPKSDYESLIAAKEAAVADARARRLYLQGPYELYLDELEAGIVEEKFFLAAVRSPPADTASLARAVDLYKQMLTKLSDPASAATIRQRKYFGNDVRFRAAVDLAIMGQAGEARQLLTEIIARSDTWSISGDVDHIYVRRYLRLPYTLSVSTVADTGERPTNEAPDEIKKFFNPRQIASFLCGLLDRGGLLDPPYQSLVDALVSFENYDYRVFLSSSADLTALTKFRDDSQATLNLLLGKVTDDPVDGEKTELGFSRELLALRAESNDDDTRKVITAGVAACSTPGASPVEDPAPFELKLRGNWEDGENPNRRTFGVYLGGNLTFEQATRLSKLVETLLNLKPSPYLARPVING